MTEVTGSSEMFELIHSTMWLIMSNRKEETPSELLYIPDYC